MEIFSFSSVSLTDCIEKKKLSNSYIFESKIRADYTTTWRFLNSVLNSFSSVETNLANQTTKAQAYSVRFKNDHSQDFCYFYRIHPNFISAFMCFVKAYIYFYKIWLKLQTYKKNWQEVLVFFYPSTFLLVSFFESWSSPRILSMHIEFNWLWQFFNQILFWKD